MNNFSYLRTPYIRQNQHVCLYFPLAFASQRSHLQRKRYDFNLANENSSETKEEIATHLQYATAFSLIFSNGHIVEALIENRLVVINVVNGHQHTRAWW